VVELSVLGISLQEENGTPLLLLHPHGSQTVLTLGIGVMEAFAISVALHGAIPSPRAPHSTAHDLMVNILRALEARLVCVHLTDVVGNAYIAEAIVSHAGGQTVIDCRPSDAVAIALRCGAPIRATKAVAALAQDIDDVMAILPQHVRAIAATKLAGRPPGNVPANTESDLGQLFAALERSAARRLTADAPPAKPKAPRIRVTLVQHTPDQMLTGLGLSAQEAEAVSGAPAEDRWGMLLRLLAPETKVPM